MGVARIDVAEVRAWAGTAAQLLAEARAELDAANVYPVPDADTGTNLAATARAAADALAARVDDVDLATALRVLATAAVRSARGNSGAILSQLLRGLADAARPGPAAAGTPAAGTAAAGTAAAGTAAAGAVTGWDAADLAAAWARGAAAARAAVAEPVDGTVLSVADAVARSLADHVARHPGADLAGTVEVAERAARVALARTPEQLPVLAACGVVDAGAHGLVLLVQALHRVVTGGTDPAVVAPPPTGTAAPAPAAGPSAPAAPFAPGAPFPPAAPFSPVGPGVPPAPAGPPPDRGDGPAYEVQYLLELPTTADAGVLAGLEAALRPLGDSLVLAGDGAGGVRVHVHVDDVAAAVEAGARAVGGGGRMSGVAITRFADVPTAPARRAVVLAGGEHLGPARAVFAGLEVDVLAPSTPAPPGELVVVAVGSEAVAAAAGVAERRPGVTVVPARSVVQAMAAVAVHDAARRPLDDTVAMAEAAGACRHAHLSVADSDGLTIVGRCRAGDVLGHVGDEIAVIGRDEDEVGTRLLDVLLGGGGELVTVLHSPAGAPLARRLAAHARALGDHLDVEVRAAGEMGSPVLLGVE